MYLLSYTDITNKENGFTNNPTREKQLADYAKALGCWMSTSADYYNNGYFWLRSPYLYTDYYVRSVYDVGYIGYYKVDTDYVGVSAAITISLE